MTDLEIIKQIEKQIGFPLKQLPYGKVYDPKKQQFIKEKRDKYILLTNLHAYAVNKQGQVIALSLDFISTYFYNYKLFSNLKNLEAISLKGVLNFDFRSLASLKNINKLDLSKVV